MIICIAGKNQIAVHGLDAAIAAVGLENVIVCPSKADDGVSRWQPSLLRYAKERGVKAVKLEELYELDGLIFLALGYDKIIRPELFKSKRLYNIHFSRLPAYKGMYPAVWPIINGEKFAGVTLHMIDWGIDTGDIIDQTEVNIGEKDTARELYFSCMESAITLLDRRFGSLLNCDYTTYTQPSTGSSYYPPNSADSSMFNLVSRQTADSIIRQSKAFHFREYQIPKIGHMPITNGVILDARSKGAAGKYVFYESETVVVSTIDYDVRFERDRSWDFHQFVNNSDVPGINNYPHEKNVVDVTNVNGWTPLMVAAYNGKIDICNALIKAGANVNATNQNGTTVLMYAKDYAVSAHDFSICELLLDAGADLHAADRFGRNLNDYVRMSNSLIAKKFFGER